MMEHWSFGETYNNSESGCGWEETEISNLIVDFGTKDCRVRESFSTADGELLSLINFRTLISYFLSDISQASQSIIGGQTFLHEACSRVCDVVSLSCPAHLKNIRLQTTSNG